MDPGFVAFLEERRDGLKDPDSRVLNGFEDADLAMYPAVRIPEIDLTIDECEAIANNLIRMLDTCESHLMAEAARALPVLAYNTLMNPRDKEQVPFFRRFPESSFTESWLRTNGVSSVDLRGLCEPQNGDENSTFLKLDLIKPNASDFQRRSSIGLWAFDHLRALYHCSGYTLQHSFRRYQDNERLLALVYGFPNSYRFPLLSHETYRDLLDRSMFNKPGELLYLFYRAAIALDSIINNASHLHQRNLLMWSVFEGGLRYGGLAVWNLANAAAVKLDIPIVQLFCDLEWALKDPRWLKYSATSLKTIDILREFYFSYKCSKELSHALKKLAGKNIQSKSESERKYRIWGELIAEKIQEKYAGRRFPERW